MARGDKGVSGLLEEARKKVAALVCRWVRCRERSVKIACVKGCPGCDKRLAQLSEHLHRAAGWEAAMALAPAHEYTAGDAEEDMDAAEVIGRCCAMWEQRLDVLEREWEAMAPWEGHEREGE